MNPTQAILSAQNLAQRANDDAAVWRAFERRRLQRTFLRKVCPLPDECLDHADRIAAELEARPLRAIGFTISKP